jgi:hypothetical protein
MARKQKRLTRKERARQQRAAIAQQRGNPVGGEFQPRPLQPKAELLNDMAPLFPPGSLDSEESMMDLMMAIVNTYDLIEEPEFEEIIVSPLQCVEIFSEVGEKMGIGTPEFERLSEDEQEERNLNLLETVTRRLFTNELRQQLITALNTLRLRLKTTGRQQDVPRVAALQLFLGDRKSKEMWPTLGLVQAIVQRSLEAGFELLEASSEVLNVTEGDTTGEAGLLERIGSATKQKLETVLDKVPGLSGFLEREADKIWDEGTDAIFEGNLVLNLFTPEELEPGLQIIKEAMSVDEEALEQGAKLKVGEEQARDVVSRTAAYVEALVTPERFEQIREQLNQLINNREYPPKWTAFLLMVSEDARAEDGLEGLRVFLLKTFIGEMRHFEANSEEEDVEDLDTV